MDDETFRYWLKSVEPLIARKDTKLRKAITPEQQLVAMPRYLATGRSLEDMKFSTIISPQSLGHIIPETCKAIFDVLKDEYFKVRKGQEKKTSFNPFVFQNLEWQF